jgi:hypothetical protein
MTMIMCTWWESIARTVVRACKLVQRIHQHLRAGTFHINRDYPDVSGYVRFAAERCRDYSGCAVSLSLTGHSEPFHLSRFCAQVQPGSIRCAKYHALIYGLVQALQHGISHVTIWSYDDQIVGQASFRCVASTSP